MLVNISRMLGVNLNWLLMGEEPMLKNSSAEQQLHKDVSSNQFTRRTKQTAAKSTTLTAAGAEIDIMVRVRNSDGTETMMWIEAKALEEAFRKNAVSAVLYGE